MTENITTKIAVFKTQADPDPGGAVTTLSDQEFADRLEAIAQDIETFERRRRRMIFRIAKLVSEAHDLFLYRRDEGGFTGWMKARFGCSSSNAYRLLDVHKRFGDAESFPNWETLSDSALYLLAPPSVPQEALDAVGERLTAGEPPSYTEVREIIDGTKVKSSADDDKEASGPAAAEDPSQDDEDEETKKHRVAMAALAAEPEPSASIGEGSNDDHVDHVHGGDDVHGGDGHGHDDVDDDTEVSAAAPSSQTGSSSRTNSLTKSAKRSLFEVWNEGSREEHDFLADLALAEFFELARGDEVFKRIPASRLYEVIPAFLDALTVVGMRTRMSEAFSDELHRKLRAPKELKNSVKKDARKARKATRQLKKLRLTANRAH